uniref:Uncharacterized protein n=1 Tax=Solanum lycopersicum TaxID=4081 RepID=A0A3Q7EXF7_SOLLC
EPSRSFLWFSSCSSRKKREFSKVATS